MLTFAKIIKIYLEKLNEHLLPTISGKYDVTSTGIGANIVPGVLFGTPIATLTYP